MRMPSSSRYATTWHRNDSKCAVFVFCLIFTLFLSPSSLQAQEDGAVRQYYRAQEKLAVALDELGRGQFDSARHKLADIGGSSMGLTLLPAGEQILQSYDQIQLQLQAAHQEQYGEYLKTAANYAEQARYHAHVLRASQDYSSASEAKTKLEDQLEVDADKDWIVALSNLAAAQALAERTSLEGTRDAQLRTEIVDQAMALAARLETDENWLASYSRVYSYLISLDQEDTAYREHAERLLRQVALVSMYVPDPNQDAVAWESRREGIDFSMINMGLRKLNRDYVEIPDYHEMALQGLNYCLTIALTPPLGKTFAGLQNEQSLGTFRSEIEAMIAETRQTDKVDYHFTQVLSMLRRVMQLNERTVQLPDEVIMAEFAEGTFSALDGYTYLVWPSDVQSFEKDMTNEFIGIGIVISKMNNLLTIDSLLEGYPAYRAGLDAGDVILQIDGRDTANITMEMAVRRITGQANTSVKLLIDRKGFDKPREFVVPREQIVVRAVEGLHRKPDGSWQFFLDETDKVAYVRLSGFYRETAGRLRNLLRELSDQGMQALVLDLRRNSGGFFNSAVNIVSQFIDEGEVVVSTRPRSGGPGVNEQVDRAVRSWQVDTDLPLIVLVDSLSASASEIVAGALQDHGRATLVGTRTYGKGNMQTIENLFLSDAKLKMTIAYYYLPTSGRVHRNPKDVGNQGYGVNPDVVVELTRKQFNQVTQSRRFGSILHRKDYDASESDDPVYTAAKMLEEDVQLRVALLCARAKLLSQQSQVLARRSAGCQGVSN